MQRFLFLQKYTIITYFSIPLTGYFEYHLHGNMTILA